MNNELPQIRGTYRYNADLSKQCWFNVGGLASLLFKPFDSDDLSHFLTEYKNRTKITPLGVGSNILISDQGFDGCIIRLGRGFNYIHRENNTLICGAACLDINVAKYAMEEGIAGLEFLSGIPGTIGGALAMNAGAYGKEISDVLISATAVNKSGETKIFTPQEIGYYYRGKSLDDSWIFTEAQLKGYYGDASEISKAINKIQSEREKTQPIRSKTSGSTFKNTDSYKAWELIDRSGCRGLKVGGAQVSEMHCNFFINTGDASAKDIIELIAKVKEMVYTNTGIMLQEEIKII